ncbi:hypothetical protein AB0442_26940 [Kitasatospora sp. NPDC085895]|uniref:hypothetical protein n=1 Tax=Kitasatospora sp. NPDC085895 TaxID=3155057 RepID=UPI00344F7E6E
MEAQLERWMAAGRSARLVQWRRPSVRASLVAAAEASVLHPAHRPGGARANVHSVFAAAFSLAGMRRHAHRHFEELGGFSSRYPWESLHALPAAEPIRHRAAALRAAGRRGGGA